MAWKLRDPLPSRPDSVDDLIEGDLDEVVALDLSFRPLERLPNDIDRLRNLQTLEVVGSGLTEIPEAIERLTALEEVDLAHNLLAAFPAPLLAVPRLRRLNLGANQIRTLPPKIGRLRRLTALSLAGNPLTALPPELADLPVDGLGLANWTPEIAAILDRLAPRLRSLSLHEIGAAAVEEVLRRVPAIETLHLVNNGLGDVPSAARALPLTYLSLSDQNLAQLSDLRSMKSLSYLAIARCGLEALPDWVGEMPGLRSLSLFDNKLTTLPPALADLGDHLVLHLAANPLAPPLNVLAKQGTKPLFAYLRGLRDAAAPAEGAPEAPAQRPAPLSARVGDGRLMVVAEAPSPEDLRAEFTALHARVRRWAEDTAARVGANHAGLHGMIREHLDLLGAEVAAMQPLLLGLANDRLERMLRHYYEDDGSNPLAMDQRGMVDALVGNTGLLLRGEKKWQDYMAGIADTPEVTAALLTVAAQVMARLGEDLRRHPGLTEPAVPRAMGEIAAAAAAAAPEGAPKVVARGTLDSLINVLAAVSQHLLGQTLTETDRTEMRKTVVQMATKGTVLGSFGLAAWGAAALVGNAADLLTLAGGLPADAGWLRAMIAAVKAMMKGD
ncbi:MAG: leucine-rich repeat domain-containing protein [Magnetospirillum sp.]|nr:leucine-rich repeat domain-containing protein [Magnetospirillum sp.]